MVYEQGKKRFLHSFLDATEGSDYSSRTIKCIHDFNNNAKITPGVGNGSMRWDISHDGL